MIAVVDCEDSYVNNLVAVIESFGEPTVTVSENSAESLFHLNPNALILSPGPGKPSPERGSWIAFDHFAGKIPILGVCLGHQTIGAALNGKIICKEHPTHGKITTVTHDKGMLFKNIPKSFSAVRYNSLILDPNCIGKNLKVDAVDSYGDVMAISDENKQIFGVQFHPESFMTEYGEILIHNFVKMVNDDF